MRRSDFYPITTTTKGKTLFQRNLLLCAALILSPAELLAGDIYKVKSSDGMSTVTYEVRFGGGKLSETYTAFDPASKTFVYLTWRRSEEAPKSAMMIWDHKTGETIALFKFPDVKDPLPIIPSIEAMKSCPLTGDRNFEATRIGIID